MIAGSTRHVAMDAAQGCAKPRNYRAVRRIRVLVRLMQKYTLREGCQRHTRLAPTPEHEIFACNGSCIRPISALTPRGNFRRVSGELCKNRPGCWSGLDLNLRARRLLTERILV